MGPASKRRKRLARAVKLAAAAAVVLVLAGVYLGEFARVNGRSMEPALAGGDRVFFEKLSVRRTGPNRFDIVVFKAPEEPDRLYIKRVVGLPEDVAEAAEGRLMINGVQVPLPAGLDWGDARFGPVAMRPGHYFVVGDNLGDSVDSRQWGPVPRDYILGRVCLRFWPVGKWRVFQRESASGEGVRDANKGL